MLPLLSFWHRRNGWSETHINYACTNERVEPNIGFIIADGIVLRIFITHSYFLNCYLILNKNLTSNVKILIPFLNMILSLEFLHCNLKIAINDITFYMKFWKLEVILWCWPSSTDTHTMYTLIQIYKEDKMSTYFWNQDSSNDCLHFISTKNRRGRKIFHIQSHGRAPLFQD